MTIFLHKALLNVNAAHIAGFIKVANAMVAMCLI